MDEENFVEELERARREWAVLHGGAEIRWNAIWRRRIVEWVRKQQALGKVVSPPAEKRRIAPENAAGGVGGADESAGAEGASARRASSGVGRTRRSDALAEGSSSGFAMWRPIGVANHPGLREAAPSMAMARPALRVWAAHWLAGVVHWRDTWLGCGDEESDDSSAASRRSLRVRSAGKPSVRRSLTNARRRAAGPKRAG